jgi:flagellar hook assembly protein FlgD
MRRFYLLLLVSFVFDSGIFCQQGISIIASGSSSVSSTIGIVGANQLVSNKANINEGIQQTYDIVTNDKDEDINYDILLPDNKIMSLDILRSSAKAHIIIVTRDGKLVYENQNYLDDWRGQDNQGNQVPDGAYYFILTIDGRDKPIKGSVTLIR